MQSLQKTCWSLTMLQNKITKIRYAKTIVEDPVQFISEKSERTIIPTSVPGHIKAIDVTDLEDTEQIRLADLHEEYSEYFSNYARQAFSFEDWASHTQQLEISPKWRTFKPDQTEEIS